LRNHKTNNLFSRKGEPQSGFGLSELKLEDNSQVAVIGSGPAGSFFSYFLLDIASRVDLDLKLDIFETRDFSNPAPSGEVRVLTIDKRTFLRRITEDPSVAFRIVEKMSYRIRELDAELVRLKPKARRFLVFLVLFYRLLRWRPQ